jgi:hypothetical protein
MLSLLANQVSLAIENARLFEETRRALAESEAISRKQYEKPGPSFQPNKDCLGFDIP